MKRKLTIRQRPQHGCARCYWYKKHRNDNWGLCMLNRDSRYWAAPPCEEYELDPEVRDEIVLVDVDL